MTNLYFENEFQKRVYDLERALKKNEKEISDMNEKKIKVLSRYMLILKNTYSTSVYLDERI